MVHGSIVPPPVIVHTKWSTSWLGLPENVKLMESDLVVLPLPTGLLLPSIAESMMVSRAVVSTVHVNEAGVGSTFPTPSTAATVKLYLPSAKLVNSLGLIQGSIVPPPPVIVHTKWSTSSAWIT